MPGGEPLSEEIIGRVDDDGTVYADTGPLSEEIIGRIDNDGTIYANTGPLSEESIGRVEPPHLRFSGAALLLLKFEKAESRQTFDLSDTSLMLLPFKLTIQLTKWAWGVSMTVARWLVSLIPLRFRPIAEATAALLVVFSCLASYAPVYVSVPVAGAVAAGVWWWYQRKLRK